MPRYEHHVVAIPDRGAVNPFTRQPITIAGRPGKVRFWEVEREATSLLLAWDDGAGRVKRTKKNFANESELVIALATLTRRKARAGFVEVGPSRILPAVAARPPASALLVDEFFAAGDGRFLDEVLHFDGVAKLSSLAAPWYRDARPFARQALLGYIDDGCERLGHKSLVKRLFKLAEAAADDEAMGHFLVAFDRLSRRLVVREGRWNAGTRRVDTVTVLRSDPGVPERLRKVNGKHAASARFSRRTRVYLARRAFRYFRRLGHADLGRYRTAMRRILPLYRDEHLDTGPRLLDAWGLVHTLYGYSPVLEKKPRGLRLREGKTLAELAPAPYFPAAWEGVFEDLFGLLLEAQSRPVRGWIVALLRTKYESQLRELPFARVKLLLKSPFEEVQRVGADLLKNAKGIELLPVREWLDLLSLQDAETLGFVCEAVRTYVAPGRLSLEQCVDLACSQAAPVATLGCAWAKEKPVRDEADLGHVFRLARAPVTLVRKDGAAWCASLLASLPFAGSTHLRDLCDSPFVDARAEGLSVLETSRFRADLALWFAMTESPYDDVRDFIVLRAQAWQDKAGPQTLTHVWARALLDVHRGGVAKRRVPRAIADRIVSHPEEAPAFLPILGFALRSVRPAERLTALASLARAVTASPALLELASKHIPEVVFRGQVTA
jgi:predicted DNA-binding WGR domain protein